MEAKKASTPAMSASLSLARVSVRDMISVRNEDSASTQRSLSALSADAVPSRKSRPAYAASIHISSTPITRTSIPSISSPHRTMFFSALALASHTSGTQLVTHSSLNSEKNVNLSDVLNGCTPSPMPMYDAKISYPACLNEGGRSGAHSPVITGIKDVVFTTEVIFSGGGPEGDESARESARAVASEGTAGGVRFVSSSSSESWCAAGCCDEGEAATPGVLAAESRPRRQGKEGNVEFVFARERCSLCGGSASWAGGGAIHATLVPAAYLLA